MTALLSTGTERPIDRAFRMGGWFCDVFDAMNESALEARRVTAEAGEYEAALLTAADLEGAIVAPAPVRALVDALATFVEAPDPAAYLSEAQLLPGPRQTGEAR